MCIKFNGDMILEYGHTAKYILMKFTETFEKLCSSGHGPNSCINICITEMLRIYEAGIWDVYSISHVFFIH